MPRFLVEVYAPARRPRERAALVQAAVDAALSTDDIRLLGSLLLTREEVCLHLFEAPSRGALARALDAQCVSRERLVPTVWVDPFDAGAV